MKGKKITNDDAFSLGLGGLMSGFGGMLYESEKENKVKRPFNTKSKTWTIDTCLPSDTNTWETGIKAKNIDSENWVIVEQYKSKEEAGKGHNKWIKFMKTKPKKLYDIFVGEYL